jgi:hypothetical protein
VVIAHAFNPSTQQAEVNSVSLRPVDCGENTLKKEENARNDIKVYQSIAQPAEHCRPVLNHGWAVHYCKARPSDKNVSWVILNPLKLAMKINHHPWHRSGLKVLICNTSCPLGTENLSPGDCGLQRGPKVSYQWERMKAKGIPTSGNPISLSLSLLLL